MKTNYILIDFENVQPDAFDCANDLPIKVIVFIGESQKKISLELAAKLQALGERAEYVRISGSGQNALDFHLAYWIGRLAERDSNAYFHIVSKDKGFDPLIKHLKSSKILAQRVVQLSDIMVLNGSANGSYADKVETVIKSLQGRGNSRPRRQKTLHNAISSLFMKSLKEDEITRIINTLAKRKIITLQNEVVTYNFAEEEVVEAKESA
ncbi:PIN domain-containing protein [Cerasicoccus maritimus]|uniref:PIN domain-containing protein n=1 Tax=Cerasicoccus maritimus TaxID=490089 RepID=UPI0028528FDC|nr:PIN domain-containing protein [Cerasicoccus maritimus]